MHYAYAFTKVDNFGRCKAIQEVDSQINNAIQNAHSITWIYSQEKMSNEIITQSH